MDRKINKSRNIVSIPETMTFFLLSHSERFPVVPVEAMKARLVPLVTDLPSGIPEIIQTGQNGSKFPINSPGKYSSAIKILHKTEVF